MTREEAAKELQSYADISWGGLNEAFEMAIAALRERDALMAEIKDMCFLCRHYNNGDGNEECVNCHDEDNFEWRGAQANVPDTNVGNKWISVKDRLPEPGKRVLVCREGFFKGDKIIDIDVRIHTQLGGIDTEWADNLRSWKSVVTHWMPLPEFPEVKKG